jgi:hypothetical protein
MLARSHNTGVSQVNLNLPCEQSKEPQSAETEREEHAT